MNNIDFNKVIGVLCAAGLVFLLGKWASETIFTKNHLHAAHHGEEVVQAFAIEVEAAGGEEVEVVEVDVAALMATADAAAGEKVFGKCKACHKVDAGANGTGPTMFGVFGRDVGTEPGFNYSDAMASQGGVWDADFLFEFLGNVKGTVPGTKMSFPGLKKEDERANLIAYLETLK